MYEVVSTEYLEKLCEEKDYSGLCWLSAVLCGSNRLEARGLTYGLPSALFLLIEGLTWFAQGQRSGVWTYFEATPQVRQQAMIEAFQQQDWPSDFSENYLFGMKNWSNPESVSMLDRWLVEKDDVNNALLWGIITNNGKLIQETTLYR